MVRSNTFSSLRQQVRLQEEFLRRRRAGTEPQVADQPPRSAFQRAQKATQKPARFPQRQPKQDNRLVQGRRRGGGQQPIRVFPTGARGHGLPLGFRGRGGGVPVEVSAAGQRVAHAGMREILLRAEEQRAAIRGNMARRGLTGTAQERRALNQIDRFEGGQIQKLQQGQFRSRFQAAGELFNQFGQFGREQADAIARAQSLQQQLGFRGEQAELGRQATLQGLRERLAFQGQQQQLGRLSRGELQAGRQEFRGQQAQLGRDLRQQIASDKNSIGALNLQLRATRNVQQRELIQARIDSLTTRSQQSEDRLKQQQTQFKARETRIKEVAGVKAEQKQAEKERKEAAKLKSDRRKAWVAAGVEANRIASTATDKVLRATFGTTDRKKIRQIIFDENTGKIGATQETPSALTGDEKSISDSVQGAMTALQSGNLDLDAVIERIRVSNNTEAVKESIINQVVFEFNRTLGGG